MAFFYRKSTFCFKVMSFGLKTASATFQWIMDKVFEKQIKRKVEVYVDDILVRSKKEEDHLRNLQEIFKSLSKVGLRLRVGKCAF